MYVILILSFIFLSFFIPYLVIYFINLKYEKFINKNSVSLKKLIQINNNYEFYPYKSFDQTHTYDNEHFFNDISCMDYLTYQLQYKGKQICEQIKMTDINKKQYNLYLNEVKNISPGQFHAPTTKFNLQKLIKKEKNLLRKNLIKKPTISFSLNVILYCSTINGRIYDKKSQTFDKVIINSIIKKLSNKNGAFFNDREIWEALCRVERGKVSNKMRFAIYKRDGYRCCHCGVSSRYANLEVDHIIPISKGGKSTYDNLQTLCHKCNVEKGNRF